MREAQQRLGRGVLRFGLEGIGLVEEMYEVCIWPHDLSEFSPFGLFWDSDSRLPVWASMSRVCGYDDFCVVLVLADVPSWGMSVLSCAGDLLTIFPVAVQRRVLYCSEAIAMGSCYNAGKL